MVSSVELTSSPFTIQKYANSGNDIVQSRTGLITGFDSYPIREFRLPIKYIKIREGFSLSIIDIDPEEDAFVLYKTKTPMISFGCILTGNIENRNLLFKTQDEPGKDTSGVGGIKFTHAAEGSIHIMPGETAKILHIHLNPDTFGDMFVADEAMLPSPLKAIIEGRYNQNFFVSQKMSLQTCAVVHEIINGIPPEIPNKIYLEGKALELIALQVGAFNNIQGQRSSVKTLTPNEKKRIREASRLLTQRLETPPNLKELANNVMLSVNKMETGFREIYGMPVFGFLREYKMQKARLLFQETSMNVSEVAWEVGYVNVSHFGTAFKKKFGLLPKAYIKKIRMK